MAAPVRVEWARVAVRDLDAILDYIVTESPTAAERTLDRLRAAASSLTSMPHRGRIVPELARLQVEAYRELVVAPYRLVYRVAERRVFVVAVLDGRRDLEHVLLSRLLG